MYTKLQNLLQANLDIFFLDTSGYWDTARLSHITSPRELLLKVVLAEQQQQQQQQQQHWTMGRPNNHLKHHRIMKSIL